MRNESTNQCNGMLTVSCCVAMSITLSLAGKSALITGGSRGIGAACVRMFRQAGAQVTFNYQKAQHAAAQLVEECDSDHTHAVQSELGSVEAGESLVRAAIERFGRLDCLVVNHGIWPPHDQPIDTMTEEQWRGTLSINLDS